MAALKRLEAAGRAALAGDEIRRLAWRLAGHFAGRVTEVTDSPGGDQDGVYVTIGRRSPLVSLRVEGDERVWVVRQDVARPQGRWVSARSRRPAEKVLCQADDDESYVLITPVGAEVVLAPSYPKEADLIAHFPSGFCEKFCALEADLEGALCVVLGHGGASIGPLRVVPGLGTSVAAVQRNALRDFEGVFERAVSVLGQLC